MVIGAQHIVLGGLVTNNELIELTRGTLKVQVHDRLYMFDAADSKNVRLGQDGVLAKHLNPQRPFGHALFGIQILHRYGAAE